MSWLHGPEGEENGEKEFNPKWERAEWDGWTDTWAKPFDENGDSFEISVGLPPDTDPESVRINFVASPDRSNGLGFYAVQFKLKDKNVFRLYEIPYKTENGNTVAEFGVHIGSDFEKNLQMNEINHAVKTDSPSDL
jgi:hypothetical protein